MATRAAVSIVLPVYNGAAYLREALASVRWQTTTAWECICVDDGSTDESGEILEQFAAVDGRFRVIRQRNAGIVGALNRGLAEARRAWVAIMHADDVAAPIRLETQQQFVQQNPDCVAVGSDILCIDPAGNPVERQRAVCEQGEIERLLLAGRNTMNHPTILMRRDAVMSVGMYRPQHEWVEDADLWLRLARVGRLANIPRVLLKYRLHQASLTWTRREAVAARLRTLLITAHEDRGLPLPERLSEPIRPLRPLRPAASKWARRAAKAGYFRTAWKQFAALRKEEGLSLHTVHVAAAISARRVLSMGRATKPPEFPLPDWRRWDCAQEPRPAVEAPGEELAA